MSFSSSKKRPTDVDDNLQDIIDTMSKTDARWKAAKPSNKKLNQLRYRALYNAYKYAASLHDKQQNDL